MRRLRRFKSTKTHRTSSSRTVRAFLQTPSDVLGRSIRTNRFSVFSPMSAEHYFGCFCIFWLRIFQRVEILTYVLWVWLNAPWIFADTIRRFPKVYWMLDVCWMIPHVSGFFWTLSAPAIVVDFFGVWWVFGSRG